MIGGVGREDGFADDEEGEEFFASDAFGELQFGSFQVVAGELEWFEDELGLLRQVHLEALALQLDGDGGRLRAEGVVAGLGLGGEGGSGRSRRSFGASNGGRLGLSGHLRFGLGGSLLRRLGSGLLVGFQLRFSKTLGF